MRVFALVGWWSLATETGAFAHAVTMQKAQLDICFRSIQHTLKFPLRRARRGQTFGNIAWWFASTCTQVKCSKDRISFL